MLLNILGIINFSVLLLFGVYVSAAFSGVTLNKKNNFILIGFSTAVILLQVLCYSVYGMSMTEKLYPLISHLPLALLLIFVYKKDPLKSIFSIMAAYLSCQISKWIGLLAMSVFEKEWVMYVTRIIVMLIIGFLLLRYVAEAVEIILSRPRKTVLIFGILPFVYYLFDYGVTVYTDLLYSGSQTVFEFLPFSLCASYLVFCVIYFKEYEGKCEAERYNQLMEIQAVQSMKEINAIHHSEYEIARLRHDMRHFLKNIEAFIKSNANEKAIGYINELVESTDQTALHKFCENDLVNMVLSYYKSRMNEQGITFQSSVVIPNELPCSDTDFTSILANGLENALQAVNMLEHDERIITLEMRMSENKLLLSIKNPYSHSVKIIDGLPTTDVPGHGIGAQSIKYVAQKHNGNCQFIANDGQFTMRVVL